MGLTFTLTSFACIGPIVGPLLVASVQTSGLQPVIGMAAFATGLALPFFVLALFPSYLQKLPKSGGWLMRVKVVLGFIVLAISIKYLSTADQMLQTNLISREMFLGVLGGSVCAARSLPARLSCAWKESSRKTSLGVARMLTARGVPDLLHQPAARAVRISLGRHRGVHSGAGEDVRFRTKAARHPARCG